MKEEQVKDFTTRITQANKSELVVVIYDLLLTSVHEGYHAYEAKDVDAGRKSIKKAQAYLQELITSLDKQYEVAIQLLALYRYINEQLIATNVKQMPVKPDEVIDMLETLKSAFVQVAKNDDSASVMENAQQLYAGLTYGKDSLNEVLVNDNEYKRGYKA